MITDFCGHYSSKHKKIYQLIFVIYFRNDKGHEDWKYCSVWGTEKATADYVIKSWELLFARGIFDQFGEIFLSRDNGGHFRNFKVMQYESEIGFRYNKIFRVRSYAPNHGYSHADRHAASASVTFVGPPVGEENLLYLRIIAISSMSARISNTSP